MGLSSVIPQPWWNLTLLTSAAEPGLDIGPEELRVKQKDDESLKKYRELGHKPIEDGKPQFFEKKGILYRRYFVCNQHTQFI